MQELINAKVQTVRKVKKVKITKYNTLDITYEETSNIIKEVDGKEIVTTVNADYTRIGKNIVHEDMLHALDLLRSHLAILCDQVEAQNKDFYELEEDTEALSKYKVRSYSIGGHDIHEGVTISGSRFGRGTVLINLNTPFTKWEATENEQPYEYAYELKGIIHHCNEEALKYLDGKIAPDAQLDLFEHIDEDSSEEGF